jgi:hypothetical protein
MTQTHCLDSDCSTLAITECQGDPPAVAPGFVREWYATIPPTLDGVARWLIADREAVRPAPEHIPNPR